MRRILLASAALAAVLLAAPFAGAQYADPPTVSPPAYETQVPTDDNDAVNDPMAPETQQTPPPVTPEQPSTQAPTADATTSATQDDPYAPSTSPQSAQSMDPAMQAQQTQPADTEMDVQSAQAEGTQYEAAQSFPVDLAETAMLAGMSGVPMTQVQVCAPRTIELATRTSRLNRDTRNRLEMAADHASVCEVQRVVIRSPDGRGDAVRQTLVAHGINDTAIEVVDDASLGIEMTFAGVAASTPQYAALFSPVQTASYPAPGAQPSTVQPGAAPSSDPGAQPSGMNDPAVEPSDDATGAMPPPYEPAGEPEETSTYDPTTEDTPSSTF